MGDLDRIKAAQLEDAREGLTDPEAHVGELTAGGWIRRARAWFGRGVDRWTPRLERLGRWIAAGALITGGLAKVIHDWRATAVAPAELPKGSGERTFVDRVDKPKAP